ncbi:MAG: hypothetical protein ACUVWK_02470 [Nitrososphaerales archaeon]
MKSLKGVEERTNIFIRLIGLAFLILGAFVIYHTANTPLIPQVSPIYYLISLLFIISGLTALISELD